jgi:putative nucleotidyltransferase with HDIG domain
MRDHVTDEHTQRVAKLTLALASRMGIPESELRNIRRGALLHDIGKMGIPDAILQKPDVLTDAEWKNMQTHPELAYKFLSHISYLAPALDIPYCHHEKWDGTGYPRKLKEEEIPVAARIFAVVDVYDALTSDRPYRKAWKREAALAYIQEQSGKYFDPDAVRAFLELLEEEIPKDE